MKIRVAAAGMHIESGTFSPLRSRKEDFFTLRGEDMRSRYPFLELSEFSAIDLLPLVHFRAMPGGMIVRADYEEMKAEIMDRLSALSEPPDAFYFDVHGAMTVEGLDDAEADLLESIRSHLPTHAVVTCSQDLHGNVSPRLVAMVDLMTTYRTAPHVDWMETRERALRLLVKCFLEQRLPYRAYVPIPVLVSGEMSSTEYEPGRALYSPIAEEAQSTGIWDASLWVGYAWADQQRSGAVALVLGEAEASQSLCESIARRYWQARQDFVFVTQAGPFAQCWKHALASPDKPVFLSDAGDNPTAGGAGDVVRTLGELLELAEVKESAVRVIYASIPDATALEVMRQAGVGAMVSVSLGAKLDPSHGDPLPVTGEVRFLLEGADPQGVLRCGGVDIIVSARRRPYHLRGDYLALGLDPLQTEVTIVKIGYLEPELKAMAAGHWLILSQGGVRADFWQSQYCQRRVPLFPFEKDFSWQPQAQVFAPRPWTSRISLA